MATDFLVVFLFWPVVVAIALLFILYLVARKKNKKKKFSGVEREHILFGIVISLLFLFLFFMLMNYFEATDRIEKYDGLYPTDLFELMISWSIYLFVLFSPFVLLFYTIALLPLLALLHGVRLVSLTGVTLVASIVALIDAGSRFVGNTGQWCREQTVQCLESALFDPLPISIPIALGFAIGARLPLVRSKSHQE